MRHQIHEFAETLAHFGAYGPFKYPPHFMDTKHSSAQQQASRATPEDLQEMALRMELIYHMLRELKKRKKQLLATMIREQTATTQPAPVVSPTYQWLTCV
jgi:hypothetical protein